MPPKLLLADDSITVQRVIALTFQGEGIDVIAVGDGDQAVETIERERPQIVLADLSMPGRDGYAVAEHVKRSPTLAAHTRVVLLTGAFEPVEEHRSTTLGIDGVLAKPFEPQVAIALVRRLLAQPPLSPRDADARPTTEQATGEAMANAGGSMSTDGGDAVDAAAGFPFESQQAPAAASSLALDDYFRRLDEALSGAGLGSPAPAPPTAQAALRESPPVTVPSAGAVSADAETMVMARPVLHAEPPVLQPGPVHALQTAAGIEPAEPWPAAETVQTAADSAAAEEVEVSVVTAEVEESAAVEFTAAAEEELAAVETFVAPPEEEPVQQDTPVAGVALVDAFSALLAAEEGRGDMPLLSLAVAPAPAGSQAAAPAAPAVDLDALADTVARKVLAQLTDAHIDAIVSERVLEVAERLVREEIERIKAEAQ